MPTLVRRLLAVRVGPIICCRRRWWLCVADWATSCKVPAVCRAHDRHITGFYEEDEPVEDVQAAFDLGVKFTTQPSGWHLDPSPRTWTTGCTVTFDKASD